MTAEILLKCHYKSTINVIQTRIFKGTVRQIGKALINDRLRVSKVSRKFCIPVSY